MIRPIVSVSELRIAHAWRAAGLADWNFSVLSIPPLWTAAAMQPRRHDWHNDLFYDD